MDAHLDTPTAPFPFSIEPRNGQVDQKDLHNFLCSLSHELCRPLASLRTGFDLLLHEEPAPVSPEQQGHVATMMGLCDDLLRLTRGYLDYAEVVRGSRPPSLGSFSIGAIVGELDRQFGALARDNGLAWEALALDSDVLIVTDASRCQHVFGNLISNAIKFTPPGGCVRVEARVEGESWTLAVEDDGPGIPAEAQERVFEPFFRLGRDEHSSIGGNGLGLSLCRELASQIHGRIALRSVVGQGTCIKVVFPTRPPSPTIAGG